MKIDTDIGYFKKLHTLEASKIIYVYNYNQVKVMFEFTTNSEKH